MYGKSLCMDACVHDHIQIRRKHGGLRFKAMEPRVDMVSGETKVLDHSNQGSNKVPKLQPLPRISWCHETTLVP
jgi:hypothetical protein